MNPYMKKQLSLVKKQFDDKYLIGQALPNKIVNIETYLVHSVSKDTNRCYFLRKSLAKKFNCKISTVNKALKKLAKNPLIDVNNNYIDYNYKAWEEMKSNE